MQLAEAIQKSEFGAASRSVGDDLIISSEEHGTLLMRSGTDQWERRPEFEDRSKGDWEPVVDAKLIEGIDELPAPSDRG